MDDLTPPQDRLTDRDFQRLGSLIEGYCGIRMPPVKKTMVEGRLRRRMRALALPSIHEYCRRIFEEGGLKTELVDLIDAVTTNKTDFFREVEHFGYLVDVAVPRLMALPHHPGRDRPMKLWSAACSVGAEPYTLAMVLSDYARSNRNFRFEVFATDISTDVLEKGKMAVYAEEMAVGIPPEMMRRYLRRSRDRVHPTIRLVPEIRQRVRFGHLNLMDADYPIDTDMDVIFCRNALIYFDKKTQHAVLSKLCRHLRPGGFLFVGHSETVLEGGLPLAHATTAVFTRT